jgi:hypothetical protein
MPMTGLWGGQDPPEVVLCYRWPISTRGSQGRDVPIWR